MCERSMFGVIDGENVYSTNDREFWDKVYYGTGNQPEFSGTITVNADGSITTDDATVCVILGIPIYPVLLPKYDRPTNDG